MRCATNEPLLADRAATATGPLGEALSATGVDEEQEREEKKEGDNSDCEFVSCV